MFGITIRGDVGGEDERIAIFYVSIQFWKNLSKRIN